MTRLVRPLAITFKLIALLLCIAHAVAAAIKNPYDVRDDGCKSKCRKPQSGVQAVFPAYSFVCRCRGCRPGIRSEPSFRLGICRVVRDAES